MQSDVDCVYFINNHEPPFDEIIKEFYDICNTHEVKSLFDTFNVKMNKNSINFEINGLEMDVVVATNFVKKLNKHQSLVHVQQREALQRIKLNPTENCYKYSSALAEASVNFMKIRNGFANEMVRIAKYWFLQLDRDFKHISGASTFIELVAVHAASKRHVGKKKSNFKAFVKFLDLMINFEKLDVSFETRSTMLKEHLMGDIALPRVIDPVNPYNNFARYWCENANEIEALKSSADLTLKRLLILKSSTTEEELINILFHS